MFSWSTGFRLRLHASRMPPTAVGRSISIRSPCSADRSDRNRGSARSVRSSGDLAQIALGHVQDVQKVPDQMKLELLHVISDITTLTGLANLEDILTGERGSTPRSADQSDRRHHCRTAGPRSPARASVRARPAAQNVSSLSKLDQCLRYRNQAASGDVRVERRSARSVDFGLVRGAI